MKKNQHLKKLCSDINLLKVLAQDNTLSNKDIASRFNISTSHLHYWFKEYGISRLELRNNEKQILKQDLIELYINQRLSPIKIGQKYNVSNVTIMNWLKRYNIPLRNRKQSQLIVATELKEYYTNKYGIISSFQLKETKDKIKATHIKRRGVEYPSQSKEVQDKIKQTCVERYGVENPLMTVSSPSKEEKSFISELNSHGFNFQPTKKILSGFRELDGYDDTLKVAVEYCGIYWHTEPNVDKKYHYNKMKECEKLGIRLYTIFCYEWKTKKLQIIDFLRTNSGFIDRKIYARKTKVVELEPEVGREFCEKYHIQGLKLTPKHAFGLYVDKELVSVMTFNNHHRNKDTLVLNRFCSLPGVSVIGGASKLLINASKVLNNDIISWSDNRWSVGNVYSKIGFVFDGDLPPDYCWIDVSKYKIYSKQSRQKSITKQPKHLTEKEYNEGLGLRRLWDCGKKRWKWKKPG